MQREKYFLFDFAMCEPIRIIRFAFYSLSLSTYTQCVYTTSAVSRHNLLSFFLLFERRRKKKQFIVVGIHKTYIRDSLVLHGHIEFGEIFLDLTWTLFRSHFLSFLLLLLLFGINVCKQQMMMKKLKKRK